MENRIDGANPWQRLAGGLFLRVARLISWNYARINTGIWKSTGVHLFTVRGLGMELKLLNFAFNQSVESPIET